MEWEFFKPSEYESIESVLLMNGKIAQMKGRRRIGKSLTVKYITQKISLEKDIPFFSVTCQRDTLLFLQQISAEHSRLQMTCKVPRNMSEAFKFLYWIYIHGFRVILDEYQDLEACASGVFGLLKVSRKNFHLI